MQNLHFLSLLNYIISINFFGIFRISTDVHQPKNFKYTRLNLLADLLDSAYEQFKFREVS